MSISTFCQHVSSCSNFMYMSWVSCQTVELTVVSWWLRDHCLRRCVSSISTFAWNRWISLLSGNVPAGYRQQKRIFSTRVRPLFEVARQQKWAWNRWMFSIRCWENFPAVLVATKPGIFNRRETTVWNSVTTVFRVKPLDMFDKLSGNLPDAFVTTKADISNQRETAVWDGMSTESEITGYFWQDIWVWDSNKNRCFGQCIWIFSSWKLGHFVQHLDNIQPCSEMKKQDVIRWF